MNPIQLDSNMGSAVNNDDFDLENSQEYVDAVMTSQLQWDSRLVQNQEGRGSYLMQKKVIWRIAQ